MREFYFIDAAKCGKIFIKYDPKSQQKWQGFSSLSHNCTIIKKIRSSHIYCILFSSFLADLVHRFSSAPFLLHFRLFDYFMKRYIL